MKEIYRFDVMDHLAKGDEVYALLFARKPVVEDAAMLPGRMLARYIKMPDIKWYVTEAEREEEEDD